jgi:hypothetical protein
VRSKLVWFVVALLVLTLSLVTVSCGGNKSATPEDEEVAEEEEVTGEEEEVTGEEEEVTGEEEEDTGEEEEVTGEEEEVTGEEEEVTGEEEEVTGEEEEEEEVAGEAPAIPHSLDGRENCLACHDIGGMRPFPDDHVGRDNESCTVCHQPAAQ